MERKLNEQWVEELEGKKHMLKAVKSDHFCSGCAFLCRTFCRDPLMGERDIDCSQMIIIKDLGVLNEDGCLPAPWDKALYPQVYGTTEAIWYAYAENYEIFMEAKGMTKQEAIDNWNRRA